VTAYVDVDREADAGRLRGDLLAKGLAARAEQDALLAIEEALEASVKERLSGSTSLGAKKALADLRRGLKL
jgi:hypothetical protein